MNRARPMAARLINKPRVEHELSSAHGHAVKKMLIITRLKMTIGFTNITNPKARTSILDKQQVI